MAKKVILILPILLCGALFGSCRTEDCFSFIQETVTEVSERLNDRVLKEGAERINDDVYIKILKEGTGLAVSSEDDSPEVMISIYEIKPDEDELCYVFDKSKRIQICSCIPGIRQGVQRMKQGEIRRIFVYPSSGYGEFAPLSMGGPFYFEIEIFSM